MTKAKIAVLASSLCAAASVIVSLVATVANSEKLMYGALCGLAGASLINFVTNAIRDKKKRGMNHSQSGHVHQS
jgi:hypothetical protein